MQNLKDSFYIALRDRLAALNPTRVVTIQNLARPAVVVTENEVADAQAQQPDTFYVSFGAAETVGAAELPGAPLLRLACEINYWIEGTDSLSYQDRGRALGASDEELLAICSPRNAPLNDYSQSAVADLGQKLFWSRPRLGTVKVDGRKLMRSAALEIYCFQEGAE